MHNDLDIDSVTVPRPDGFGLRKELKMSVPFEYKTEEEYRRGGWRCFHCDETFTTPGAAQDHFGNYLNSTPGCIIKVQVGDERGWLMELRKLQEENAHLRQQMDEEYWDRTAFDAHLKTFIQSFRPFRKCETLRDVFNIYDSMEGRALAAEDRKGLLK